MEFRHFFPLGKAYGEAFCNRTAETEQLVGHIENGKHSLLVAPRRYGKSSLAERALEKAQRPFIKLNLHLCTTEEEVAQLVVEGVIKLIGTAIGPVDKLMVSIKKYLSNLEPLLSFGNEMAQLRLVPKKQSNYSVIMVESLMLIENLLKEKDKRGVIFFDEFQEIDRISKHKGMEGAIRTAAQEMQNLSIIFSGSVRSMLLCMFEDENRPLYKLCRKIRVERISTEHYEKHLNKIALATWKKPLDPQVFNHIMKLSHRHPYYVNYLCDSLWEICQDFPSCETVERAWQTVVTEEWSDALKELSELPLGQLRLLKYVANEKTKNIQSQESSVKLSMPPSSIASAASALIEKDYVEQDEEGYYQIINPLLSAVLKGAED